MARLCGRSDVKLPALLDTGITPRLNIAMQPNLQSTDETPLYDSVEGTGALIIAAPHVGTHVPTDIAAKLNATGRAVNETDFHVHRLYDFAAAMDASTLFATHSRYVVDLNRDPAGSALYPGLFETPMCPTTDFDRHPIYDADGPDAAETERRRILYWKPYHDRLRALLDRAVARYGHALLIDAHSIRPAIPDLFEGRLPDLNFGLNDGLSAAPVLAEVIAAWSKTQDANTTVIDGRFKGGFTTRHYGRPESGIHAIQIEIVQDCYLNMEAPHLYDAALAAPLSHRLSSLVEALVRALP